MTAAITTFLIGTATASEAGSGIRPIAGADGAAAIATVAMAATAEGINTV